MTPNYPIDDPARELPTGREIFIRWVVVFGIFVGLLAVEYPLPVVGVLFLAVMGYAVMSRLRRRVWRQRKRLVTPTNLWRRVRPISTPDWFADWSND